MAKNVLDSQGRTVNKFVDNLPGNNWAYSLLQRHKSEITRKIAANIKRPRADVSREVLSNYFNNLENELKDVPPSNVFNYDETNLQDDPGKKKMIFRRGIKYPEQVCNFSKSATSIMMCISASGVLLPPYVIYKAEKMWKQWTENGPKGLPCCNERCCALGCRYNRTHHGWIDAPTFNDWFESTFLPHAKKLPGRKILLGDNLSSHFSDNVINMCEANNIAFVCLPKNATHLTQPLDVVFFRPFKEAWRAILTNWKRSHINQTSIDKRDFPQLLKDTLTRMDTHSGENAIKRNIVMSFQATGIVPFRPDRVLDKLPKEGEDANATNEVSEVLVNYLKEKRYSTAPSRRNIKRTKLSIEPGKSVAATNNDSDSTAESDDLCSITSGSSENQVLAESEDETEYIQYSKKDIIIGTYVLVKVLGGRRKKETYRYVAVVLKKNDNDELEVNGLKSLDITKTKFKITEDDEFTIGMSDIIAVLPDPTVESTSTGESSTYNFAKLVDVKEM